MSKSSPALHPVNASETVDAEADEPFTASPSEADTVLQYFFSCAVSVCQAQRIRKTSEDSLLREPRLVSSSIIKPRVDLKPFQVHSDHQAKTAYGRARTLSHPETWVASENHETELKSLAASLVEKHISCVRCADGDVDDASRMGPSTFVVTKPNAVMIHVWNSRREAHRFHEAMRRLAQAKLDHLLPSPFHTPLTALVAYQGSCVTVAWLPPLYSDIIVPDRRSSTWIVIDVLRCALHMRRTSLVTLYFGADGRFYVLIKPSIILYHEDPIEASMKLSDSQRSSGVRYECLEANPLPLVTSVTFLQAMTQIRNAAAGVVALFAVDDSNRTVAIRNINSTIPTVYAAGSIAQVLHQHGVPIRHMALVLSELRSAAEYRGRDASPWIEAAVVCLKAEMIARVLLAQVIQSCQVAMVELGDARYATADIARSMMREAASEVLASFLGKAAYFTSVVAPAIKSKYLVCAPKLVEPMERKDIKLCLAAMMKFVATRSGFSLSSDHREMQNDTPQTLLLSTASKPFLLRPENRGRVEQCVEIAFPSKTPRAVQLRHHLRALLASAALNDANLHTSAFTVIHRALTSMADPSQLAQESASLDHVEAALELLFDAAPSNACEREARTLLQHHEVDTLHAAATASFTSNVDDGGGVSFSFDALPAPSPKAVSAMAKTIAQSPFLLLDHLSLGIRALTVAYGLLTFSLGPKNQAAFLRLASRLMTVGLNHISQAARAGHLQPPPTLVKSMLAVALTINQAGHNTSVLSPKGAQTLGHTACRCILANPEVVTGADVDGWHAKILRALYEILATDFSSLFGTAAPSASLDPKSMRNSGSSIVESPLERNLQLPSNAKMGPDSPLMGSVSPGAVSLEPLSAVPMTESVGSPKRSGALTGPRGQPRAQKIPDLAEHSFAGLLPLAFQLKPAAVQLATQEPGAMVTYHLRFVVATVLELKPACIAAAIRIANYRCRTGAVDLQSASLVTTVGVAGLLAAKKAMQPPRSPNAGSGADPAAAEQAISAALVQACDLATAKRADTVKNASLWGPIGFLLRLLLHECPRMEFVMDAFHCFRSFLAAHNTPAKANEALLQAHVCLRRVHRVKSRFQEALDLSVVETRKRWLLVQTEDIGFRSVLKMQEAVLRDLHWFHFGAPLREWCEQQQEPYQRNVILGEEMSRARELLLIKEVTHRDVMLQWEDNVRRLIVDEARNSHQHAYLVSTVGVAALQLLNDDAVYRSAVESDELVERKLCRLAVEETRARYSIAKDVFTVSFLVKMMPEWALTMFHWYFWDFCQSAGQLLLVADEGCRQQLMAEENRRRTTITQLCAMGPQKSFAPTRIVPTAAPVVTSPPNDRDKPAAAQTPPPAEARVSGDSTPVSSPLGGASSPTATSSTVQFGRRAGKGAAAESSPPRVPVAARRRG